MDVANLLQHPCDTCTCCKCKPKTLKDEVFTLERALFKVSGDTARTITKKHWRKCVIGSVKDQSFLVRAILKYSDSPVYIRVLEEYSDQILSFAGKEFLVQAFETCLKKFSKEELGILEEKLNRKYEGNDEEGEEGDEDGDEKGDKEGEEEQKEEEEEEEVEDESERNVTSVKNEPKANIEEATSRLGADYWATDGNGCVSNTTKNELASSPLQSRWQDKDKSSNQHPLGKLV
jgi:hypothetical protein